MDWFFSSSIDYGTRFPARTGHQAAGVVARKPVAFTLMRGAAALDPALEQISSIYIVASKIKESVVARA